MKKAVCVLLAVLLICLTGCSAFQETVMEAMDDPQILQTTEAVLDCIIAGDIQGAWTYCADACTQEEFAEFCAQVTPLMEGVESYTLAPHYVQTNNTNGVTSKSIRYLLTSGETQLWVTAVKQEGLDTLVGFHVYLVTTETGTLRTAGDNDVAQWVLLVIGMAEIGLMLVVLVDCIRHKMKQKWLWILVILLGGVTLLLTATPQGTNVRFNFGLFLNSYTALLKYNTGGFTLRLLVPVGSIVYLCRRKFLLKQEEAAEPEPVPAEEVTDEPSTDVPILPEEPPQE